MQSAQLQSYAGGSEANFGIARAKIWLFAWKEETKATNNVLVMFLFGGILKVKYDVKIKLNSESQYGSKL